MDRTGRTGRAGMRHFGQNDRHCYPTCLRNKIVIAGEIIEADKGPVARYRKLYQYAGVKGISQNLVVRSRWMPFAIGAFARLVKAPCSTELYCCNVWKVDALL